MINPCFSPRTLPYFVLMVSVSYTLYVFLLLDSCVSSPGLCGFVGLTQCRAASMAVLGAGARVGPLRHRWNGRPFVLLCLMLLCVSCGCQNDVFEQAPRPVIFDQFEQTNTTHVNQVFGEILKIKKIFNKFEKCFIH